MAKPRGRFKLKPAVDGADVDVSKNGRFLAYAEDLLGRRIYTIRIRDIATGRDLDDRIENAAGADQLGGARFPAHVDR